MKVWVVTSGKLHDDYTVEAVFSSEAKTQEFINLPALKALRAAHPKAHLVAGETRYWLASEDKDPDSSADFNDPFSLELDSEAPTEWLMFPKGRRGDSHPGGDTIGRKFVESE